MKGVITTAGLGIRLYPSSKVMSKVMFLHFPEDYFEKLKNIEKSIRGKYEIVDILNLYREEGRLDYSIYNDVWIDCRTLQDLYRANKLFAEKKPLAC